MLQIEHRFIIRASITDKLCIIQILHRLCCFYQNIRKNRSLKLRWRHKNMHISVFKYKSNSISNLNVTPFFRSSVVQVGHLPHIQIRKESQKVLKWLICELNDLFIFHFSEICFSWFCCFLREIPDVIKKKFVLSFFSYINTLQIDRIYVKSSFSKVFTIHRTYRDYTYYPSPFLVVWTQKH